MKFHELFILFILAISVLVSYSVFLKTDEKYNGYLDHPLWFGMNSLLVKFFVFFQIFAVLGFLISIGSWLFSPPKTGAVKNSYLFWVLVLFFLSAILWPVAVYYKNHFLVAFSLVLTAIASIWLLAGSIEEDTNDKWKNYRVIGLTFLCITTVLGDAVVWNSNYLKKVLYSKN